MVKSKLRYYTYKITFKDLPKYFYYGRHKDSGKPYFGSPRTWRHLWDQFEPEIQILQWYETEEDVNAVEKSIIMATWKDKYSLNENCGGVFSEETCKKAGKIGGKLGGSKNTPSQLEAKSKNAHVMKSHPNTVKARLEIVKKMNAHPNTVSGRSKGGKNSKGGSVNSPAQQKARSEVGQKTVSIMNAHPNKSEWCRKGVAKTNAQKWMCTITGFISNAGGLSCYQRVRGIDTKNRVRIQ